QFMLDKGKNWVQSITPEQVAPYFHNFYMEKTYRKHIDFSNKTNRSLWDYDEQKVARLIANMPMKFWIGKDKLMKFENNHIGLAFEVSKDENDILRDMTQEICTYKLDGYFERRMK